MRMHPKLKSLALALALAMVGSGCILIPEIEERVVELAVGHSIVVPFTSFGEINTHDETETVNVALDVSLDQILADKGISAADVKDVKLAGVAYRVTQGEAGRTITGGTVEFRRHPTAVPTGTFLPLITSFNADAGAPTAWITVPLNSTGVADLNVLLADLLDEAKGNGAAANTWVTYHVNGTSNPIADPTDFKWEFRLSLTIVGTFRTDIVN
ncbi:MAG: hypothetical protein ABIS67_15475 [Candidatus Eisenbacteria bacterium]